jgi:hypothetical protein
MPPADRAWLGWIAPRGCIRGVSDLSHVHAFTRGLDLEIQAATALTMPFHNGCTEGVNPTAKMV